MNKKYQVFLSSTFRDLTDERSKVIQTILEFDCIPTGMELFPAIDEDQFEYIKKIIDLCDYYIVIIGGRYGSISDIDGLSYTEKEYDYAISKDIKVLGFIHENPQKLIGEKLDKDVMLINKLESFKSKVASNKLVKFWNNADELSRQVALSLNTIMANYPATGWIKLPEKHESALSTNYINKSLIDLLTINVDIDKSDNYFKSLITRWIIEQGQKNIASIAGNKLKLNALSNYAYLRNVFGGILDLLSEGDHYHTISTLEFLMKDFDDEKEFWDINFKAIKKKVNLKRIILIDNDLMKNPERHIESVKLLSNLLSSYKSRYNSDKKAFDETNDTFLITDDIKENFSIAPYATIFKKGIRHDGDYDYAEILQITTTINEIKDTNYPVIRIEISNDDNCHLIKRKHAKFLDILNNKELKLLSIEEMIMEFTIIEKTLQYHPSSIFSKGSIVWYLDADLTIFHTNKELHDVLFCIREEFANESYTSIDYTYTWKDNHATKEYVNKSKEGIEEVDHYWRLYKIDIPNAINRLGVLSYVSSQLYKDAVSTCIICLYNSELVLIKKDICYKFENFLRNNKVELQEINRQTPI